MFWQSGIKARSFLNKVVSEIKWSQRLDEFNHSPHFPFVATHFTDAMPFASIGGALSDVLFNPKYAGNIYKVMVAVNFFGEHMLVLPEITRDDLDVFIWDQHGPQCVCGDFLDFEVGLHHLQGAHPHCDCFPESGQVKRPLSFCLPSCELWQWKVLHNVWQGGETELHETIRILQHMEQFVASCKVQYQPYGPWPHVPEGLWTNNQVVIPPEEGDDESVLIACRFCGKPSVKQCGS